MSNTANTTKVDNRRGPRPKSRPPSKTESQTTAKRRPSKTSPSLPTPDRIEKVLR